jgi:putative ABC transport system permease protein
MSIRDLFVDTFRTLSAHKLRTFLTMFGIVWGVVSITLMVAAGEGLRVGQKKVADNFGKDIMIFSAGRTSLQVGGTRAGRAIQWEAGDYKAVEAASPSCGWVMPELGNTKPVHSAFNSASLLVTGSLPPFADVRTIPVAEGRFYNWDDEAAGRRVAFLGSDARQQLFAGRPALGQTITLGGVPYTVIGVMLRKEQDSSYDGRDISKIFVPFSAVLRDFPNKPPARPHSIDRMLITPRSLDDHEACKTEVRRALARLHKYDPLDEEAAMVWDTIEGAKAFTQMTEGMKNFLGAVGLVSLMLGGLGVMNVMLVAVRERTREIGMRKAVGATRRSILSAFFIETMIIVFVSGAAGMSLALGLCAAVNTLPMPEFFAGMLATWQTSAGTLALLGTVAVLSALYPARRAASVDPIEALRHEAGG